MIEVKNLCKSFKNKNKKFNALDNVDLNVKKGEIFGYLGSNGAGKTTTIKIICSLMHPDSGEININGYNLNKNRSKCRGYISAVLEGARNSYWRLSVYQNLIYFANFRGYATNKKLKDKALKYIELFDLKEKKDVEVAKLSIGMKQKVALCIALITNPEIIFLDEPTLGLDVETAIKVRGVIKYLSREENKTIFLTSHNMDLIEKVCDRVAIIKKGKIIGCDSITNLKNFFSVSEYEIKFKGILESGIKSIFENKINRIEFDKSNDETIITLDTSKNSGSSKEFYDIIDLAKENNLIINSINKVEPDFEKVFINIINK